MGMIIMNGKEYTSIPKDGFPPIIYSDEEREIGVWRDGKPLYQKVVFVASVSKSGSISLGIANVDKIFLITGQCYDIAPFPYVHGVFPSVNVGGFFSITSQDTTWELRSGNDATDPVTDVYLIVQYTKTTDTPGSGKYTTYGGLTHHYSTNEQVVGTWIDGKPLYEKTFANIAINTQLLTSIDMVVLFRVSTHGAGNNAIYHDTGDGFTKESSKLYTLDNGVVTYMSWSGSVVEMEKTADFIICQYTKTTE